MEFDLKTPQTGENFINARNLHVSSPKILPENNITSFVFLLQSDALGTSDDIVCVENVKQG